MFVLSHQRANSVFAGEAMLLLLSFDRSHSSKNTSSKEEQPQGKGNGKTVTESKYYTGAQYVHEYPEILINYTILAI